MGARGPSPKPTAVKKLEGNPGKQKLNDFEPAFEAPVKCPSPPVWLLKEAKKEWKKLAPALIAAGVLTLADMDAFAALCQNYAYMIVTDQKITDMGKKGEGVYRLQEAESGYLSPHPLLSLRSRYFEQWRRSLGDFGLTPASRSRIVAAAAPSASADPVEQLLSKGG